MPETTTTRAALVSTYFASGSNRPAEIRAFARVGQDVGVAAATLSKRSRRWTMLSRNAEAELVALAGSGRAVFVDSGAFSEVEFNAVHTCKNAKKCAAGECIGNGNLPHPSAPPFTFVTVAPIDDAAWRARLALYLRLGAALGSQLYVVAPDKVGDQAVTLERLERYAAEIRAIRATGARVLVAIQKGAMTQAAFATACAKVLGFSDFVHALPCKKAATSDAELSAYVAAVKPSALHLLGLGVRNDRMPAALEAIGKLSPATVVTCDSCLLAASSGRTNGPGNGPRVLTACTDLAKALIAAGRSSVSTAKELGILLAFGPAAWRAEAEARLAAVEAA